MSHRVTIGAGFPGLVARELAKAREKHRGPASPHEGYAILLEEVDEFWDEVKRQKPDPIQMLKELAQIGVVAQRIAEEVVAPMFPGQEDRD